MKRVAAFPNAIKSANKIIRFGRFRCVDALLHMSMSVYKYRACQKNNPLCQRNTKENMLQTKEKKLIHHYIDKFSKNSIFSEKDCRKVSKPVQ